MPKSDSRLIQNFNFSRSAFFNHGAAPATFSLHGNESLEAYHANNIDKLHNENRKFRQMMETELALLTKVMRPLKRTLAADEHAKLVSYYIELSKILAMYYSREHYNSPQRQDHYLNPQAALDKLNNLEDVPEYCRPLTFAGIKEFLQAKKNKAKKNIEDFIASNDKTGDIQKELHISSIKAWAGIAHVNRIYWTFFKLTLLTSLVETKTPGSDAVSQAISMPNEACNVASAGILYLRLLMNFSLMWKHVHFGLLLKGAEGRAAFKEELYDEFDKRGENMLNDLVWGTINLLTNFDGTNSVIGKVIDMGSIALPAINSAPIPIANIVTAAFLLFDVAWNTYQLRYRDLPKYKRDKERLEIELHDVELAITVEIKANHGIPLEIKSDPRYINDPRHIIAKAKLDELEANWAGKWWQHATCVGAAFFLLAGFSATMFFTGGMAIPICFAAVLFGTAMYFCAESVGNLVAAQKRVSQHNSELKSLQKALAALQPEDAEQREVLAKSIGDLETHKREIERRIVATQENIRDVKKDRKETVYKFAETIGRNLIMPGLILGVAAFCWPAALAITISYAAGLLALKAYRSYAKSKPAPDVVAPVVPVAPPTPVLTRKTTGLWQGTPGSNDFGAPLLGDLRDLALGTLGQ